MDVINIVIIRQRIELEVARLGKQQEQQQKKSWFSSWWGGTASDEDNELSQSTEICKYIKIICSLC